MEEEWIKKVGEDKFTFPEETDKDLIQDSKSAKIWNCCRSKAVARRLSKEEANNSITKDFPEEDVEAVLKELVSRKYLKEEKREYAIIPLPAFETEYLKLLMGEDLVKPKLDLPS